VENPLVKVLTEMEFEGVAIDVNFLNEYSKELEKEAKISEEMYTGRQVVRFNLASPKQLGEVLFDKLQLDPKPKKQRRPIRHRRRCAAKTGTSKSHCGRYPGIRELTKLKSTYVDSLRC